MTVLMNLNEDFEYYINWNTTEADIIQRAQGLIATSKKRLENLLALDLTLNHNCRQFLLELNDDTTEFMCFQYMCDLLQLIGTGSNATTHADILLTSYTNDISLNKAFYRQICKLYDQIKYSSLYNEEDRRLVEKVMIKCIRSGINLENDDLHLLVRIKSEITKIERLLVNDNINSERLNLELTEEQLDGVSHRIRNELPIISNNPIRYAMPLTTSNYLHCMRYMKNDEARQYVEFHYCTRGRGVLTDIMRLFVLRHKHAQLLSFNSHSDYVNSKQMTQSSSCIKEFLTKLLEKLDYRYNKEIETLLRFKRLDCERKNKPFDSQLNSWDIQYYITRWRKEYGLNDNTVREYFSADYTISQIIDLYGRMFSLKFIPTNQATWHPDVTVYRVEKEHTTIGFMFMDIYARTNKYNQIRCVGLQPACNYKGSSQLPISGILASFRKPDEHDTLLSHLEVVDFFHEMLHAIHHLTGRTTYSSFSGINVERDYVETPAMVMENLCWDKTVLKRISKHYKTGEPIPDCIVDKMLRLRDLNIGIHYRRHVLNSIYDQLVHSDEEFIKVCETTLKNTNPLSHVAMMSGLYKQLYGQVMTTTQSIGFNNGIFMPTQWINFVGGSDAQYYSYIWSKIHSADVFMTQFTMLTADICHNFQVHMLSPGGSIGGTDLLRNYLNREPTIDKFLIMHNLKDNAEMSFFFTTDQIKNKSTSQSIITSEAATIAGLTPIDILEDEWEVHESEINRFTEYNEDTIHEPSTGFIQEKMMGNFDYFSETSETLKRYDNLFIKPT